MLLLASFPSFLSPYAPKALAQALLSPRHLGSFSLHILCIPLAPLGSLAAPEHHLHTQVLPDVRIFSFGCFLHTNPFVLRASSLELLTQSSIPSPCPGENSPVPPVEVEEALGALCPHGEGEEDVPLLGTAPKKGAESIKQPGFPLGMVGQVFQT